MNRASTTRAIIFLLGTTLCLGLASVWLNIERMDTAYELRRLESKLHETGQHMDKLTVERDALLSPTHMRRLAERFGLAQPAPEQIRRVPGAEG